MKTTYDPRYIEMIARIRTMRESLGISQRDLASMLGKPQPFISKIERYERRLDILETLDICSVLNIKLSALLTEDSKKLL